jgi:hypothetical protein
MKDKEKQIEEMAQCKNFSGMTCSECKVRAGCDRYTLAEELYEQGYRKLPEDSVVLSREELNKIQANFFDSGIKYGSKETAEKILTIIGNMLDECDDRFKLKDYQWHKNLCKQFGVEIKE